MSISGIGTAAEISIQPGISVIQTAVNNAVSGDVIILKPGTYYDNVKITKENLTIKSYSGNPDDTIINAKSRTADVFLLQADSIKINGLKISGATATRCSAINLSSCRYCAIENNKLLNNLRGINLLYSHWNMISKNTATSNTEYGIVLGNATANTISGNTVPSNARGIHIGNSDSNTLSDNTVRDNSVYGLYVCPKSDRNTIYDNYFSNTNMAIKNGIGNAYSITKTAGTNIVGGPYKGGNYWAKPDGTGFSQTAVDKDGDGISDSAYTNISGSIYSDLLPLVTSGSPGPILPVASFSSNVTSGNKPLTIAFTDTSTGSPATWSWSFGDGTSATTKNPVHIYSEVLEAGNYTVALTATNTAGSSNTTTKSNYISVTESTPTPKLVADFSGNITSGNAPLNVAFTDKSTGSPNSWKWSFGDGTSATTKNPVHTYSGAGSYTVTLIANNTAGSSNTTTKSAYITVAESTPTPKPLASFNSNATSGIAPLTVLFTSTSTNAASVSWNFGDGTPVVTGTPVSHTFTNTGTSAKTVTVTLTATNLNGTSTKTGTVTVNPQPVLPVASFTISPTSGGTTATTFTFADTSTNTPTSWSWDFGDKIAIGATKSVTHKFATAGTYTVKLTATNGAGSATTTKSVIVSAGTPTKLPVASFTASPTSGGTTATTFTFADTSTNTPTTRNWKFGDGGTGSGKTVTHKFTKAGKLTVTLTAGNTAGSSTATKSISVAAVKPVASFSYSPTKVKKGATITFTSTSTNIPTTVKWTLADNRATSSASKATHVFSKTGPFKVTLVASNSAGSSTVYKTITVS